jgi:hypothetical protein
MMHRVSKIFSNTKIHLTHGEQVIGHLTHGVFPLADPDYAAWPLKMTSTALNLYINHHLKHRPDVGKPKAPI